MSRLPDPRLEQDEMLREVPEVDGDRVLGPAVLYEQVGAGAFGRVYRAFHVRLRTDVAVKVLLGGGDQARFQREAEVLARLSHQNLVRVYDSDQAHGLCYIVMEWVEGEDAARRGALSKAEAVGIVQRAAAGLAEAHRRDIVHRDVKPANIMISSDGDVKLTDLGLAKERGRSAPGNPELTQSEVIAGTPVYMPPEQWRDFKNAGPPADVFAFGATLYRMLVGRAGVQGSQDEIEEQICQRGFPSILDALPELDPRLAAVVDRATAIYPSERYADAAALEQALAELELGSVSLCLQDPDADTVVVRSHELPAEVVRRASQMVRERATEGSLASADAGRGRGPARGGDLHHLEAVEHRRGARGGPFGVERERGADLDEPDPASRARQ